MRRWALLRRRRRRIRIMRKKKEEGKEEEVLEEEQEKVFNKFDIGFQAWLRNLTQVQLSGKRWDAVRLESKFKPSACRGRQMS